MRHYEFVRRSTLKYRSIKRITEPAIEPVSLAEAKSHLRVDQDFTDDDLYIQSLISAARHHIEAVSDRTLIRCQWQIKLDQFPSWDIELPRPPIAPDNVSVTFVPSQSSTPMPLLPIHTLPRRSSNT